MRLIGAVLWLVALPAFGQALPDLGSVGDTTLAPQVERRIGESIMRDIRFREPSYLDDPEIADYLGNLGARITQAAALNTPPSNPMASPIGKPSRHSLR